MDSGGQKGGAVSLHRVELLLNGSLGPMGKLRHFMGEESSVKKKGRHRAI